ncbi:hypothetical protein H9Q74_010078 [Fusarium xylarioides]|nr:hypothetical protein H9Q74_010078 [Fusarium xylarioides]KAG5819844.1 hypothetical protein H9Q71_000817 [Fusarium xylarioides]
MFIGGPVHQLQPLSTIKQSGRGSEHVCLHTQVHYPGHLRVRPGLHLYNRGLRPSHGLVRGPAPAHKRFGSFIKSESDVYRVGYVRVLAQAACQAFVDVLGSNHVYDGDLVQYTERSPGDWTRPHQRHRVHGTNAFVTVSMCVVWFVRCTKCGKKSGNTIDVRINNFLDMNEFVEMPKWRAMTVKLGSLMTPREIPGMCHSSCLSEQVIVVGKMHGVGRSTGSVIVADG